jgi:hypothetical protein
MRDALCISVSSVKACVHSVGTRLCVSAMHVHAPVFVELGSCFQSPASLSVTHDSCDLPQCLSGGPGRRHDSCIVWHTRVRSGGQLRHRNGFVLVGDGLRGQSLIRTVPCLCCTLVFVP